MPSTIPRQAAVSSPQTPANRSPHTCQPVLVRLRCSHGSWRYRFHKPAFKIRGVSLLHDCLIENPIHRSTDLRTGFSSPFLARKGSWVHLGIASSSSVSNRPQREFQFPAGVVIPIWGFSLVETQMEKIVVLNGSRIRMILEAGKWINVSVTPIR